jgi:hypothetical protein
MLMKNKHILKGIIRIGHRALPRVTKEQYNIILNI